MCLVDLMYHFSLVEVYLMHDKTVKADAVYQLILMDIKMPLKNGYEAAEEIRKSSHPDAETVPIIAMTANSFKEDMDAAFASGMNGFVPKPIDIGYLNQVMEENLKKE